MLGKIKAVVGECRGVTLIELLVAMSLLTIVTVAAFNFFGFAQRSWQMAGAEAEVESEARFLLMQVERDVRSVKRGSFGQPGIKILNEGCGLNLHSYMEGQEKIVEYNFQEEDNLLVRKLFSPAEEPDGTPTLEMVTEYQDIYRLAEATPLFTLDENRVGLKFIVETSQGRFTRKAEVDTGFTIRNKGVEQDDQDD